MNAVVLSNCLIHTTPSEDASSMRTKNRNFQEFMDSLSWNNFVKKVEEKIAPKTAENTLKRFFGGASAGIKVRNKSKK